jgi:hypothetical protein
MKASSALASCEEGRQKETGSSDPVALFWLWSLLADLLEKRREELFVNPVAG